MNPSEGSMWFEQKNQLHQPNLDKFMEKFKQLSEDTDNTIYFYSRKTDVLTNYEKAFRDHGYTNFHFRDRSALKDFVSLNKNRNNY